MKDRIRTNRPDATPEKIKARQEIAEEEMKECDRYDYTVINIENHPEIATSKVSEIIENKLSK
jgi:guanylate kinase